MTPSQQMYLRLMGRKAIASSLKYRSLKPAPIKDRVLGIFSNETSEVRCGWMVMMLECVVMSGVQSIQTNEPSIFLLMCCHDLGAQDQVHPQEL